MSIGILWNRSAVGEEELVGRVPVWVVGDAQGKGEGHWCVWCVGSWCVRWGDGGGKRWTLPVRVGWEFGEGGGSHAKRSFSDREEAFDGSCGDGVGRVVEEVDFARKLLAGLPGKFFDLRACEGRTAGIGDSA